MKVIRRRALCGERWTHKANISCWMPPVMFLLQTTEPRIPFGLLVPLVLLHSSSWGHSPSQGQRVISQSSFQQLWTTQVSTELPCQAPLTLSSCNSLLYFEYARWLLLWYEYAASNYFSISGVWLYMYISHVHQCWCVHYYTNTNAIASSSHYKNSPRKFWSSLFGTVVFIVILCKAALYSLRQKCTIIARHTVVSIIRKHPS